MFLHLDARLKFYWYRMLLCNLKLSLPYLKSFLIRKATSFAPILQSIQKEQASDFVCNSIYFVIKLHWFSSMFYVCKGPLNKFSLAYFRLLVYFLCFLASCRIKYENGAICGFCIEVYFCLFSNATLNSKVLSSKIYPRPSGKLMQPVEIILSHLKRPNSTSPECVFWKVNQRWELVMVCRYFCSL